MLPTIDVVTAPATTPVSYIDAKTHLRLDDDFDRASIVAMIEAATAYAEGEMSRSLIKRTLRATTTAKPSQYAGRCIPLPRGPVIGIVSVNGDDSHNVTVARHGTTYLAEFPADFDDDDNGVVITYHAGYGEAAEDVPADIRLALLMHVAHLYRHREITSERPQNEVAHGLEAIYARHRAGGPLS